jgi:hypothetical protein
VGGFGGTDVSHSLRARALRWPQYFDRRIRSCGNHLTRSSIPSDTPPPENPTDRLRTPAHVNSDDLGLSSGSRERLGRGERLPTTGTFGPLWSPSQLVGQCGAL